MKNRKLFAIITLVAFMLTMMPVMAFGVGNTALCYNSVDKTSIATVTETDNKVDNASVANAKFVVNLDADLASGQMIVIIAERSGSLSALDTFTATAIADGSGYASQIGDALKGVSKVASSTGKQVAVYLSSKTAGVATVSAYLVETDKDYSNANRVALYNLVKKGADDAIVTKIGDSEVINIGSVDTDVVLNAITVTSTKDGANKGAAGETGSDPVTYTGVDGVGANNGVDFYTVQMQFTKAGAVAVDQAVSVSADKVGVTISETALTTNKQGIVKFNVSATKGGTYLIKATCDGEDYTFKVVFGSNTIVAGSFVKVVEETIATGETYTDAITLRFTDAFGNVISPTAGTGNMKIVVSKKPATSAVALNTALTVANDGTVDFKPDVAGEYTFKLYNISSGTATTATINAAKFGKIDHITVAYDSASYALGETTGVAKVKKVDADGVVSNVSLSANLSYAGVGVANFNKADGQITFEKAAAYAGQQIVVTAVYNNYIASTTLTIGVQPATINFTEATGKAGATVTVTGQLADLNGNAVALSSGYLVKEDNAIAVVVAQPEGAIVYADASKIEKATSQFVSKGIAKVDVTSNKEGIVKVNVIAPVVNGADEVQYYVAGTATVNFGGVAVVETPAESIVNMIIGANTVIADGKASASPVAPFIENGRTFVPVRAFAEATGATVNYDAATQVITIKATGVDAQMTVGSNVMTVNGETVVMDAAAQVIGEGYTVLPVRYAGQALGYSFDVAYGANGAVTAVTMTK